MDPQRRHELWSIALENFRAARLSLQREWYNVSAGRSYYAAYTAMWLALGGPVPPHTRWSHEGIAKQFARGEWKREPHPILRELRKAMGRLYQYRLKADYHGRKVAASEARESLATAGTVLGMVADEFGLPKGALRR